MRYPGDLHRGRLVRRYKRFLADVELENGDCVTAHCANPGSMLGVSRPGSAVYLTRHHDPKRKLPWSLEAIRVGRIWVGIHTLRTNRVVAEALERGRVAPLAAYSKMRPEAAWTPHSRADFLLEGDGLPPCWVEVKNVTLARGALALFPDAVTDRGRRHLDRLRERAAAGDRAVLLFAAARSDVRAVGPADGIDPAYGEALRTAAAQGVEVLGYRMRVGRRGLTLDEPVAVDLGPHRFPREAWED
jgi:sugar fermentation stimulation protein A